MNLSHKLLLKLSILALMIAAAEGSALLAGLFLQKRGIFYTPSASISFDEYQAKRDEALGWPDPATFGCDGLRDEKGSRVIPAFPDPGVHKTGVSLYGDSYTYGYEVGPEHAWSNLLSIRLNRRVANYGVTGYGSDQAYLRFLRNENDEAAIVILNHLSENILRNVNQYRKLLVGKGPGVGFKPRFILDENKRLRLIPLVSFSSKKEFDKAIADPGLYFQHDYFVPGGPAGKRELAFPYTLSVLRSINNIHIRSNLFQIPVYFDFYQDDHPSQALPLTVEILAAFAEKAISRGKAPVITLIPTEHDLCHFRDTGKWPYQSLIDGLKEHRVEHVLNLGEGLINLLGRHDPERLYGILHFNKEGNRLLARIMHTYLEGTGLVELID